VASSIVYYAYQQDIRRERERVASGSEVVQTRCGPIEYAAIGAGHDAEVMSEMAAFLHSTQL
jgi:hypothetical protein